MLLQWCFEVPGDWYMVPKLNPTRAHVFLLFLYLSYVHSFLLFKYLNIFLIYICYVHMPFCLSMSFICSYVFLFFICMSFIHTLPFAHISSFCSYIFPLLIYLSFLMYLSVVVGGGPNNRTPSLPGAVDWSCQVGGQICGGDCGDLSGRLSGRLPPAGPGFSRHGSHQGSQWFAAAHQKGGSPCKCKLLLWIFFTFLVCCC